MKYATITFFMILIIFSCSGEKKERNMVDINLINEDGTLNSRQLFRKEIDRSRKMTEKKLDEFK